MTMTEVTEVEVPARVSVVVVDGQVTDMNVTLLGSSSQMQKALIEPAVVKPSRSDVHDKVALRAADGYWDLSWDEAPAWLHIDA